MPTFSSYGENKLIFLDFAKKVGLTCPKSIITNNKKELLEFYDENKENIISKPFYFANYYFEKNITKTIYTRSYNRSMIHDLPDFFFPTLFQQKVDSIHEIRIFFLDGKFYSSAAMCIGDSKKIDLKLNYRSNHMHWIAYKLPDTIEKKLHQFMLDVNLNTGSIDVLRTEDDFVFIEVNPVGQFLAPSNYCNYYLESEIKDWLIEKSTRTINTNRKETDYEHITSC